MQGGVACIYYYTWQTKFRKKSMNPQRHNSARQKMLEKSVANGILLVLQK